MLKNKDIFRLFIVSDILSVIVSVLIVYYTEKDPDIQKNNTPIIVKQNLKQTDFNKSKEEPLREK